jgi:alkanesulfonate monooxygenase SsuD/methylene tetrahydromethanopterin reductase-like flavin-dependent oxidoreductase (luciferase family)
VKFGISTFITDEGIGAGPLAAAVEQRGFNSLCVTEHSHIPVAPKEPVPAGGQVPRVDVVSRGRLNVGVGVGWNLDEMRNHGTTPATRGDKMNEQLAALKQIWTQDEAEFHGRYIDFDPIFSWPKPIQRPHPPIYIGGESRAAMERLRTVGDGWLPQAATAPEKLREVRQWLADNDRPDVPVTIWGAGRDKATLAGYAAAEVDEVSFLLPTRPESATLRDLDELTALVRSLS